MPKKFSFAKKFAVCFILSVLSASTLLLIGADISKWIRPIFIFRLAAILFITPYILLPIWEYKERRLLKSFSSLYNHAQDGVAFLTGLCIAIFGWKKIFGMQFRTPLSVSDLPMSSLRGEALTWFYFGHSTVFGLIIAFLQVIGSLLLFFRRTRLFAIFILLPVMLNILLIDIFYQLNPGALLQSLVLTGGLVYLLSNYYQELTSFLFKVHDNPSRKKNQQMASSRSKFLTCFFICLFCQSFRTKRIPGFWRIQSKKHHTKWEKCHTGFLSGQ